MEYYIRRILWQVTKWLHVYYSGPSNTEYVESPVLKAKQVRETGERAKHWREREQAHRTSVWLGRWACHTSSSFYVSSKFTQLQSAIIKQV